MFLNLIRCAFICPVDCFDRFDCFASEIKILSWAHPINFGFVNDHLPLFRNTNIYIKPHRDSYNNPIQYTNNALLSGYISEENYALLKNSVPFQVGRLGKGRVMVFTDNTNFRAFWYGTNKLLMNAIFFGDSM